jgi:hypothetical protein
LVAIPVTVVSSYIPSTVTSHRAIWISLLAGTAVLIVLLTWLSNFVNAAPGRQMFLVPPDPSWVDRSELAEVVSSLTSRSSAVALTTGLTGAGGFGKTTLAARACHDSKVKRRFRGGFAWVTIGKDAEGPGLAARIAELVVNMGGDAAAFTSPEQAGHALAKVLAGHRQTLLVVDDVWTAAQVEPFTTLALIFHGRDGCR